MATVAAEVPAPSNKRKQEDRFEQQNELVLPAGQYYISDPGYVLDRDIYDAVWGEEFKYEDGAYVRIGDKAGFMMTHTADGDGTYMGSDGKAYDVDSGTIGVIATALCTGDTGGYEPITFDKEVRLTYEKKDGVIKIESGSFVLNITTDPPEESEDDDDDEDATTEEDSTEDEDE